MVGRSPLPWLNRVALNLCYTRLGRRRLPTRAMDDVVSDTLRDQALGPDELAEHQELCQTVRTGIAAPRLAAVDLVAGRGCPAHAARPDGRHRERAGLAREACWRHYPLLYRSAFSR